MNQAEQVVRDRGHRLRHAGELEHAGVARVVDSGHSDIATGHPAPPSRGALHTILDRTTSDKAVHASKVLDGPRLLELRELVRKVPVARSVQDYAVRVLQSTHPKVEAAQALDGKRDPKREAKASDKDVVTRFVRYGASPRGAQALLLGAKVLALLDGRFAASCKDVKDVARPALRHRLILNFEGQAEGIDPDQIIDAILQKTPETSPDLDGRAAS